MQREGDCYTMKKIFCVLMAALIVVVLFVLFSREKVENVVMPVTVQKYGFNEKLEYDRLMGTYSGEIKNGKPDGKGKIIVKTEHGTEVTFTGGFRDGMFIVGEMVEYYEYGQLLGKCKFKDGKVNGNFTLYYSTGQLQAESIFKDGKPNGKLKIYYPDGKLQSESEYKNGKLIDPNFKGSVKLN